MLEHTQASFTAKYDRNVVLNLDSVLVQFRFKACGSISEDFKRVKFLHVKFLVQLESIII